MDKTHKTLAIHLATYITDKGMITAYVNRQYGTRYSLTDILAMLAQKPTASIPRRPSQLSAEPVAPHAAISTSRGGIDPLAVATNAYLAKHRKAILKSLKA
jgi:hypothetical protein